MNGQGGVTAGMRAERGGLQLVGIFEFAVCNHRFMGADPFVGLIQGRDPGQHVGEFMIKQTLEIRYDFQLFAHRRPGGQHAVFQNIPDAGLCFAENLMMTCEGIFSRMLCGFGAEDVIDIFEHVA